MELRHLRCFIAVAEELHFARAAERLHIEQSPMSRAIKELEEDLGVKLFVRTTRSTRLTRAGKLFQEHVSRVFTALQQARDSVNRVLKKPPADASFHPQQTQQSAQQSGSEPVPRLARTTSVRGSDPVSP